MNDILLDWKKIDDKRLDLYVTKITKTLLWFTPIKTKKVGTIADVPQKGWYGAVNWGRKESRSSEKYFDNEEDAQAWAMRAYIETDDWRSFLEELK